MVVITSYSIHYTKLYDRGTNRGPDSTQDGLPGCRNYPLWDDNVFHQCRVRMRIWRSDVWVGYPHCLAWHQAGGKCCARLASYCGKNASKYAIPRITSYNVCYTKLLRGRDPQGIPSHRARPQHADPGIVHTDRITSYNVCYTKLLR